MYIEKCDYEKNMDHSPNSSYVCLLSPSPKKSRGHLVTDAMSVMMTVM